MAFPTSGGLRAISTQTFSLDPLDSAEYRLRPASFKQPLSYGSKRTRNQANCAQYFTKAPQSSNSSLQHSRSMIIDKETTKTLKKSIHRAPSTLIPGQTNAASIMSSGRQQAQLETHFISCVQRQMEGRLAEVSTRHPIQDSDSVASRYNKAREIKFSDDAKFKRSIATLAEDLHYEPQISQQTSEMGRRELGHEYHRNLGGLEPHRTPEKQLKRSQSRGEDVDGLFEPNKGSETGSRRSEFRANHDTNHRDGDFNQEGNHRETLDWNRASEVTRYYQRRSNDVSKSPHPPSTAAQAESTVKESWGYGTSQLHPNRQSLLSRVSWSQSQSQLPHSRQSPLPREFDPQEDGWEFVKIMENKIDDALRRSRSRLGLEASRAFLEHDHASGDNPLQPLHSQTSIKDGKTAGQEGIGIWMPTLTLITPEKEKVPDPKNYAERAENGRWGTVHPVQPHSTRPTAFESLDKATFQSRKFAQLQGSDENVMILGSPIDPAKHEVPERYDDPLSSTQGDPRGRNQDSGLQNLHKRTILQPNSSQLSGPQSHQLMGAMIRGNHTDGQQPVQIRTGQSGQSLISTETQGLAFRGLAHDINKRNHFVANHPEVPGVYAYELNSNFLEEVWSLRFVASQELRVLIADSVVFVGDKKNGIKCGKGKYLTQRGGRILYEGFFYDNLYHGEGHLVNPKLSAGPVRDGWWRDLDSLEHWQQFQGHFSGGYPEGLGTLFIANGDSISGVFLRGRLNGGATLRLASNPSKEYFGQWLDNILNSELQ